MISGIENIGRISYSPQYTEKSYKADEPLHSFEVEDRAIISAEAKLLNELEKFNSGEGNIVDLAVTSVLSEHEVAANARVIDTKKELVDVILGLVS